MRSRWSRSGPRNAHAGTALKRTGAIADACAATEVRGCTRAERDRQLALAHVDGLELSTNVLLGVSGAALLSALSVSVWAMTERRRLDVGLAPGRVQLQARF